MKNNSAVLALFVFIIGLSFPVFASNIITAPLPDEDVAAGETVTETTTAETPPVKSFDTILDQQLSESEEQPALTEEEENALEQQLIDPDFLKDDVKAYDDYAKVTLRFLNKITAESETYDLQIGKTVVYGSLRIRPQACKKSPPIEEPESASFLQIWEKIHDGEDQWIFSGWMFASSPSLSSMEHPVYDVWVIDCKD